MTSESLVTWIEAILAFLWRQKCNDKDPTVVDLELKTYVIYGLQFSN